MAERYGEPEKKAEPPKAEEKPGTEPKPEEPAVKADEKKEDKSTSDLSKRYAILERRETKHKARESKLAERESKVSRAEHNLAARFGDPESARKAYDAGQHHEAAKYIQRIFGDDFAEITKKIARATAGLSPEKLKELEERDRFTREKREFEEAKAKAEREKNQGATREKAIGVCKDKCAGHDALKLKNGADLVLREMERNWDADTKSFKVSWRQAADAVVAEKMAEAEALGLKRPTATLVPKKEEPKPEAKPEPIVTRKRGERFERPSFEQRHAEAARIIAKRRAK